MVARLRLRDRHTQRWTASVLSECRIRCRICFARVHRPVLLVGRRLLYCARTVHNNTRALNAARVVTSPRVVMNHVRNAGYAYMQQAARTVVVTAIVCKALLSIIITCLSVCIFNIAVILLVHIVHTSHVINCHYVINKYYTLLSFHYSLVNFSLLAFLSSFCPQ